MKDKVSILAYLCDEVVETDAFRGKIDGSLEDIATIEKEKRESDIQQRKKQRNFKCPILGCTKSYGLEGALKTHVKLKHTTEGYVSSNGYSPEQLAMKKATELEWQSTLPNYYARPRNRHEKKEKRRTRSRTKRVSRIEKRLAENNVEQLRKKVRVTICSCVVRSNRKLAQRDQMIQCGGKIIFKNIIQFAMFCYA